MRKAERGQERDGVAAERTEEALDPDGEGPGLVAKAAGIAAMADEAIASGTARANPGTREGQLGEVLLVTLDVSIEICDNEHALW
jgi:hypothetical protein